MSAEQLDQLLKQAEVLSAEEKLLLAKRLTEQAHNDQSPANSNEPPPIAKSLKRNQSLNWLKQHQAEYAGRYVALDGERLIAEGLTYQEAALAAKKSGTHNLFITHVPDPNTTYFAGW